MGLSVRSLVIGILSFAATAALGREILVVPTNAPVAFFGDSLTAGWARAGKAVWNAHYAEGYVRWREALSQIIKR